VARARAEVDDPVGVGHHRLVVLDHDDRLAAVDEAVEQREELREVEMRIRGLNPYARLHRTERCSLPLAEVLDDVVSECLAVARADGIDVQDDIRDAVAGIALSMATQKSSTAHDVARGRHSEIDYLNGYVLRRAAAHGLQAPVNRTILALVRLLEQGKAEPVA